MTCRHTFAFALYLLGSFCVGWMEVDIVTTQQTWKFYKERNTYAAWLFFDAIAQFISIAVILEFYWRLGSKVEMPAETEVRGIENDSPRAVVVE